jgi:hypothetical protein
VTIDTMIIPKMAGIRMRKRVLVAGTRSETSAQRISSFKLSNVFEMDSALSPNAVKSFLQ